MLSREVDFLGYFYEMLFFYEDFNSFIKVLIEDDEIISNLLVSNSILEKFFNYI